VQISFGGCESRRSKFLVGEDALQLPRQKLVDHRQRGFANEEHLGRLEMFQPPLRLFVLQEAFFFGAEPWCVDDHS
jgi:hypothetical protein